MPMTTGIEWCDSTVSPTTGCDGCELWKRLVGGPCYAGNLHEMRLAKALPDLYAPTFTEVRLAPGRMAKAAAWSDLTGTNRSGKPWLDGRPRVVFVGDMADVFSRDVPFDYLNAELIDVATGPKGSRHIWMLLTKLPRRMAEFSAWLADQGISWPENVWAGTSITTQRTTSRIEHLLKVPAKYRYLSVEPQREFIDLSPWLFCERCRDYDQCGRGAYLTPLDSAAGGCWFRECYCSGISLVIQGGESDQGQHKGHPFNVAWARSLRDDCKDAKVSYFMKQFGSHPYVRRYNENSTTDPGDDYPINLKDSHGGDWSEWSEDLKVRQFPKVESLAHV